MYLRPIKPSNPSYIKSADAARIVGVQQSLFRKFTKILGVEPAEKVAFTGNSQPTSFWSPESVARVVDYRKAQKQRAAEVILAEAAAAEQRLAEATAVA